MAQTARHVHHPVLRGRAAESILDAVSVLDLEDDGSEAADNRALLALHPLGLGLDLENAEPELKAYSAATTELLWVTLHLLSQFRGEDRETTIGHIRGLLPGIYPEAYGGPRPR